MKFLKDFNDQESAIGYTADTPFISTIKTVKKKALLIPRSAGEQVEIIDDGSGFITYDKISPALITISGEVSTSAETVSGESCIKIVTDEAYLIIPKGMSSVTFYHFSGVETQITFSELLRSELDSEDTSLGGDEWITYNIEDTSKSHFIKLKSYGGAVWTGYIYISADIIEIPE